MTNVRYAKEKDITKIVELLYDIAQIHHIGMPKMFKSHTRKYGEKDLAIAIKDEAKPLFVLVNEEDEVLGYCLCEVRITKDNVVLQDRKVLFIDDLCMDEKFRNKGLGKVLFDEVKKIALEVYKVNSIELNVWEFNKEAIKFYENCDFKVQKRVMELEL